MTAAAGAPAPRRSDVGLVYAVGLFQGICLVATPAAAAVLTSPSGYDLSQSRYGLLFLPQVVAAVIASLALPSLARRFGLRPVFLAGQVANLVAMVLLAASNSFRTDAAAFPTLLVATASLGTGFGLTLPALSAYAGAFAPRRREVALTSLNVLLGLGTALSPLLVAAFTDLGEWWYLPLLAAAGMTVLLVCSVLRPFTVSTGVGGRASGGPRMPPLFWVFAGALVLYGICETMFGNWGTTKLRDAGASAAMANYALAAFWAAVTAGRLLIAVMPRSVPTTSIYRALPLGMAATLLLVAELGGGVEGGAGGIMLFALGGLACSGFFPMTVGYGEATFPRHLAQATGWLVAAYQVGYGLAAFGAGAIQGTVSLVDEFRVAAGCGLVMAGFAIPIVRSQRGEPRSTVG